MSPLSVHKSFNVQLEKKITRPFNLLYDILIKGQTKSLCVEVM